LFLADRIPEFKGKAGRLPDAARCPSAGPEQDKAARERLLWSGNRKEGAVARRRWGGSLG